MQLTSLTLKLFFLFYSLINFVNSQTNTTDRPLNPDEIQEFLKNISSLVPNVFQQFVSSPYFSTLLNKLDDNVTCYQDLRILAESLAVPEKWALEMVDATAKPQTGILSGNVMHLGAWDECVRIDTTTQEHIIRGKYCVAMLSPHEKYGEVLKKLFGNYNEDSKFITNEEHIVTKLRRSFAFCLPQSCSAEDLQLISNVTEEFFQSPAHLVFVDEFCNVLAREDFSTGAIVTFFIFGFFGVLLVTSTLYDVLIFQRDKKRGNRLFAIFSVVTNGRKIFALSEREEGNLSCLDGMRVLSMMWIIVCHRMMYDFFVPQTNTFEEPDWSKSRSNSIFVAGTYAVDTFFLISGLLVTYVFAKHYEKGVKISVPMLYVHRLMRIWPSFGMLILFSTTLLKYMGDGPFWPVVYIMNQKPCEDHWWASAFFIQNYIYHDDQCVGQGWYLAVDLQMYFLSPLILFPLMKWPKRTLTVLTGLILFICGYTFYISYIFKFNAFFFDTGDDINFYLYTPTHVRGTVYIIGMMLGYFIHIKKNKSLNISRISALCLWVISLAVMLFISLVLKDFMREEYNVWKSAAFNAFSRIFWGIAVATIIFLCIRDYGGFINSFLSNSCFQILSRINYNTYLLHLSILRNYVGHQRVPIYYTNMLVFHEFWGDYMMALALALIWTLAFESPIIALEKIMFTRHARSTKEHKNGVHQVENSGTCMENGEHLHGSTISIIPNEINLETVTKKL